MITLFADTDVTGAPLGTAEVPFRLAAPPKSRELGCHVLRRMASSVVDENDSRRDQPVEMEELSGETGRPALLVERSGGGKSTPLLEALIEYMCLLVFRGPDGGDWKFTLSADGTLSRRPPGASVAAYMLCGRLLLWNGGGETTLLLPQRGLAGPLEKIDEVGVVSSGGVMGR